MTLPSATAIDDIDAEIQKVASMIDTARRLLAGQKMVDLTALTEKVEDLCKIIDLARMNNAETVIRAVTAITEDLDRLESELTIQNESVNAQLKGATVSLAAAAYKTGKDGS